MLRQCDNNNDRIPLEEAPEKPQPGSRTTFGGNGDDDPIIPIIISADHKIDYRLHYIQFGLLCCVAKELDISLDNIGYNKTYSKIQLKILGLLRNQIEIILQKHSNNFAHDIHKDAIEIFLKLNKVPIGHDFKTIPFALKCLRTTVCNSDSVLFELFDKSSETKLCTTFRELQTGVFRRYLFSDFSFKAFFGSEILLQKHMPVGYQNSFLVFREIANSISYPDYETTIYMVIKDDNDMVQDLINPKSPFYDEIFAEYVKGIELVSPEDISLQSEYSSTEESNDYKPTPPYNTNLLKLGAYLSIATSYALIAVDSNVWGPTKIALGGLTIISNFQLQDEKLQATTISLLCITALYYKEPLNATPIILGALAYPILLSIRHATPDSRERER
jgi:hypothetical protein